MAYTTLLGGESVAMRQIIEAIGRALNLPVISIKPEDAGDYHGPLSEFAGLDMPASRALTQQRLGWTPTEIDLRRHWAAELLRSPGPVR